MKLRYIFVFIPLSITVNVFGQALVSQEATDACNNQNKAHELESTTKTCLDLEERPQLETVKLSPQIRSTKPEQQDLLNNVDLAPFIGGSGGIR